MRLPTKYLLADDVYITSKLCKQAISGAFKNHLQTLDLHIMYSMLVEDFVLNNQQ